MKIAIIDDQQKESRILSEQLSQKLKLFGNPPCKIDIYQSGEAFLSVWKSGLYDLVILDIYMEGINGIAVARRIRETDAEVLLAFCSFSNEFAGESYEVNAHFYLHKPYTNEQLDNMLARLNLTDYEMKRSLMLPDGKRVVLRNVLYTEYSNHVVYIHQKQSRPLRYYLTQAQAEALFCQYPYFLVPSRGMIVNLYEVAAILPDAFRLSNGQMIPISRRRAKEVHNSYAEFHFEKLRKEM